MSISHLVYSNILFNACNVQIIIIIRPLGMSPLVTEISSEIGTTEELYTYTKEKKCTKKYKFMTMM